MARIKIMMKKACPFRGFTECLLERCMAWSGFDCRMFFVSPMLMGGGIGNNVAVNPTVTSNTANTSSQEELQGAVTVDKQEVEIEGINNEEKQDKQEKQNPTAKVTVKEYKVTKNGNTRAVCKVEGGKEDQVVIAKNGAGELLQKDKEFQIEYNVMKDGDAWYAIKAKQL